MVGLPTVVEIGRIPPEQRDRLLLLSYSALHRVIDVIHKMSPAGSKLRRAVDDIINDHHNDPVIRREIRRSVEIRDEELHKEAHDRYWNRIEGGNGEH